MREIDGMRGWKLNYKILIFTLYFIFLLIKGSVEEREFFGEELLIRPLPDGNVLAHLQFTNSYYLNKSEPNLHFSLFPKPLAQIIDKFDVENLQLTFTQGRWNGEEWGAPILDAPHGVQLISSFYNETDVELNWKRLINSLSGLFCSSLNALDETTTAVPTLSYQYFKGNANKEKEEKELHKEFQESWKLEFKKEAEKDGKSLEEYFAGRGIVEQTNQEKNFFNNVRRNKNKKPNIKFAAMPSESVCTENLTPWVKLLPCRDQSGLGTLLNPLYLYDTLFHSMTIYVRSFPSEDGNTKIELSQTLSIVFPAAQKQQYSIASLYGAKDLTSCQLANISNVYVQLDENNRQLYALSPAPHQLIGSLSSYSLSSDNLKLKITKNIQSNNNIASQPSDNDIIAHRYLLGYGDERGGVVTQITNTNPNDTLHIYYFDYLPWFLPVYYHKLKIIIDGRVVDILDIDEWRLEPGRDHGRPSIIELGMFIPPSTTTTIMYYFEKSFLIWTEHPPDAHRGFDVVSACITTQYDRKPEKLKYTGLEWSPVLYQEDKGDALYHHHTYTEGLLVLAPTPDFSMPYNVITLTCTMFTLVFSSTINVITRRFDYLMKGGEYSTGRLSLVLYRKLRNYFLK